MLHFEAVHIVAFVILYVIAAIYVIGRIAEVGTQAPTITSTVAAGNLFLDVALLGLGVLAAGGVGWAVAPLFVFVVEDSLGTIWIIGRERGVYTSRGAICGLVGASVILTCLAVL